MFEALSDKLSGVFDRLRRRGALSEADVTEALREVRVYSRLSKRATGIAPAAWWWWLGRKPSDSV